MKNRPGAEFDTEIGACGTEHFLSFAERADYSAGALMPSLETLSCGAESVLRFSVGNSELVQRIRLQTESVLRLSVGNSELVQRKRLQTRAEAAP